MQFKLVHALLLSAWLPFALQNDTCRPWSPTCPRTTCKAPPPIGYNTNVMILVNLFCPDAVAAMPQLYWMPKPTRRSVSVPLLYRAFLRGLGSVSRLLSSASVPPAYLRFSHGVPGLFTPA